MVPAEKFQGKDRPALGIYELDGDTLKIAVGMQTATKDKDGKVEEVPSKRPADFSGKEGSAVLVFKRVAK